MADKTIRTIFDVQGASEFTAAMKDIGNGQKMLSAEMAKATAQYKLNGDKAEYNRAKQEILAKQVELQTKKVNELKKAHAAAADKLGENADETQGYARDVAYAEAALTRTEARLKETTAELKRQESQLAKSAAKWQQVSDKAGKAGKKFESAGRALTMGVTAPIMAGAAYAVKAAMDYESAFAGVKKTVDGTAADFNKLSGEIRKMSTEIPASAASIAGVAEAAGQLGIKKDNIMGFTKTIVDLGNATNLSGEQGASSLAKFANITQMSQKDFDRLGSTIVALGNNSATTEADIVAMGMRLAGAGKQAGMSEADIMSLAAVLSSVGIEAEAGGSAMSKMMSSIQLAVELGSEDLGDFAKVAGMTADEFSTAFKTNASGALTAFVTGLGNTSRNGKSAIAVLDDLNISETRMRDALLRASGAGNLMNDTLALGNKAWSDNVALVNEANQRYETNESKLQIARNKLTDMAITVGAQLLPPLVELVEDIAKLAQGFSELSPETQQAILKALAFAAALGPMASITGKTLKGVSDLTGGVGKLMAKMAEGDGKLSGFSGVLAKVATSLSGKLGIVAAAGLAVGALALIADSADQTGKKIEGFKKQIDEAKAGLEEQNGKINASATVAKKYADELVQLSKKTSRSNEEQARMHTLVAQLNGLFPDLALQINEHTGALEGNTDELYRNIDALVEQAKKAAFADSIADATKGIVDNQLALTKAQQDLAEATNKKNLMLAEEGERFTGAKTYLGEAVKNTNEYDRAISEAQAKIDRYNKALKENTATVDELQRLYDDAFPSMAKTQKESTDGMMQQNTLLKTSTADTMTASEDEIKDYYKALEDETRQNKDEMGGILADGIKQLDITADQMLANLNKQTEQYRAYGFNMKKLAKKIPPDVYEEIAKLGPQAAGLIEEMNEMSDAELQEVIRTFRDNAHAAEWWAVHETSGMPGKVGNNVRLTWLEIDKYKPQFAGAGQDLGTNIKSGFWSEHKGFAPLVGSGTWDGLNQVNNLRPDGTRIGTQLGAALGGGVESGIGSKKVGVFDQNKAVIMTMDELREYAKSKGKTVGEYMSEGLAVGIESMEWRIRIASENAIKDASRRMRATGMVHSPSRLTMKIGEYLGEGLAVGIENRIPMVGKASERLISEANKAMQTDMPTPTWSSSANQASRAKAIAASINLPAMDYHEMGRQVAKALDGNIVINFRERELGRAVVLKN